MIAGLVRTFRRRGWRAEYGRVEALRALGRGRRAFLVGNGPSLGKMDLSPLANEFVCVANMGFRAVGPLLPHADLHIVMDTHRYRRFADEIEPATAAMPYRFRNLRMRGRQRRKGVGARPYFLTNSRRKLAPGEPVPDLAGGLVTGSSVLVSAAVLLDHLGFEEICVIGCDLDYSGEAYFYETGALDDVHEADPAVQAKRRNMVAVNGEFAILREDFERRGRRIVNAGIGGNLESLPRVAFDALFAHAGSGEAADRPIPSLLNFPP